MRIQINTFKPQKRFTLLICLLTFFSLHAFADSPPAIHFKTITDELPWISTELNAKFDFNATGESVIATNFYQNDPRPRIIYQSNDSGVHWKKIPGSGNYTWEWAVYSKVQPQEILGNYVTDQGPTLTKSFDNGLTWHPLSSNCPKRNQPEPKPNYINQHQDHILFTGSDTGKLYLSTDGGLTCTAIDKIGRDHQLAQSQDGETLMLYANNFVSISKDQGQTWSPSILFADETIYDPTILIDPTDNRKAIAVGYTDPKLRDPIKSILFKTEDTGRTWQEFHFQDKTIPAFYFTWQNRPMVLTASGRQALGVFDPNASTPTHQPLDVYVDGALFNGFTSQYYQYQFIPYTKTKSGIYMGMNGFANVWKYYQFEIK